MPGVCSPVDQCSIMYLCAAALVINPFMRQTFPKYLNSVTARRYLLQYKTGYGRIESRPEMKKG
jgi:hypothetical protein